MIIGLPKETMPGETRIALLPQDMKQLASDILSFHLETGAGLGACFSDESYKGAGAEVVPDVYPRSDVVIRINPPEIEDVDKLKEGSCLVSLINPFMNHDLIKKLAAGNISTFCLELIPRSTYAQSMDVLSSQATVAGYRAVLNAASHMGKFFPMLMTPAGTIKPAQVLIIGAGVAGLQAIATAGRLGAKVEAFDVRPAAREQVESLGAKFLYMDLDDSAETESGYAVEMNEEFIRKEMELLHDAAKRVDAIITTALIFGKKAPVLIKDYMVDDMQTGSCIIDLASENGGNCELTQRGDIINHNGVTIDGRLNLPSQVPYHASQMLSKNISKLLSELILDGKIQFDMENEIVRGCLLTHEGKITHEMTKNSIEGDK